jgi:DNA-binding response OmpR family regulator
MLGPILLCGNDPVLLNTRKMVLSHAGFIVSVCTESDIASMPQNPAIALAVMGHSMPQQQQLATAAFVRAKWHDARILYLTNTSAALVKISTYEYESGSNIPAHLVDACKKILDPINA